jgi:hypothetical protein
LLLCFFLLSYLSIAKTIKFVVIFDMLRKTSNEP